MKLTAYKYLILLLYLFIFVSCNKNEVKTPSSIVKLSHKDSLAFVKLHYDSIIQQVHYSTMKNLGEPDFRILNKNSYRLILWQAFDTCSVLFRIEKDSLDTINMTVKYFKYKEIADHGRDTLIKQIDTRLSLIEWNLISEKANESYLWSMEFDDNPNRNGFTDGSSWIIEGKRIPNDYEVNNLVFKDYTILYRRCPYKGSLFDFGSTLVKFSKSFSPEKIYPGD